MNEAIVIRRAETPADYRSLQEAQRLAWGITEASYIVPIATMVGAQLHGGLVLGAFGPGREAVGLSFAFLGRSAERLCLYSQLTGIVPAYQGSGLGERMKQEQRRCARQQGLDRIVWAFDPLQAGNAHFNLAKLGATASRYIEDMYGPRTDDRNAGTPTDRLIAEWDLDRPLQSPLNPARVATLPQLIDPAPSGESRPGIDPAATSEPTVLLEIPPDINGLRRAAPELATAWRLAVRQAFQRAFQAGYRAVGFVRDRSGGSLRVAYVLHRGSEPSAGTAAVPSLF